jgi:hypothetical protein
VPSYPAERNTIQGRAAAKSISSLNASSHFTSRIQPLNWFVVNIHDLSLLTDVQATHGVVHFGPKTDAVKWRSFNGLQIVSERLVKFVFFGEHSLIVLIHSFCQHLKIHLVLKCKIFQSLKAINSGLKLVQFLLEAVLCTLTVDNANYWMAYF